VARVAVVSGGRSLERRDSLRSGHHVQAALAALGHDAVELDVDEGLATQLTEVDATFIALHGRDGEDGTIQSICEALGVPYTGSGPAACELCYTKPLAKGMLDRAGISTPDGYVVSAEAVRSMGAGASVRAAADRLGFPLICKPAAQGSALGLVVVTEAEELSAAVMTAFNYGDRVLLEHLVKGTEVAVTVVGAELEALPAVEIRTPSGVFDFHARVTPGGADLVCPAEVPADVAAATGALAVDACRTLGARDFARVDMIVTDHGPCVLEVKPCPGLTETSLLTLAVDEAGLGFDGFVRTVLGLALGRSAQSGGTA